MTTLIIVGLVVVFASFLLAAVNMLSFKPFGDPDSFFKRHVATIFLMICGMALVIIPGVMLLLAKVG